MPRVDGDDIFDDEASDASDELVPGEYTVEKILNKKFNCKKNRFEYRIKWKDWPESANTWEPEGNLDCPDLLEEFEKRWKKRKNKMNKEIPISEFIVKDGTDKRKRKRSKETDDDFIVSDEDDSISSDDDDFIVPDDASEESESGSSASESESSSTSADRRRLKRKTSGSSSARQKKLTVRMKALHREDLKKARRTSKSRDRRGQDMPGTSRQSSSERRKATRKSGGVRESRYRKHSVPETTSEESDSELREVQTATPAKKKKVIHESDDDHANERDNVQPTPRTERKRVVISDSESDQSEDGAHDVTCASDAMSQLSVEQDGSLETPGDVQNDAEENIQDVNVTDEDDDDEEVLQYSILPDVSFDANQPVDDQPVDEEHVGEASEDPDPHVANGTVTDSPGTSKVQPEGIPYVELHPGEPNGFDNGWAVEVVHDIIRGPNGGRNCIVKFKDQRYSQLIEAEIVRQHAPREMLIMLHKKIGVKL